MGQAKQRKAEIEQLKAEGKKKPQPASNTSWKIPKSDSGTRCQLFVVKHDSRDNSTEFKYGEVIIPNSPQTGVPRSSILGSLGFTWGHGNNQVMPALAEYLSHSPSLQMVKMGLKAEKILDFNTGMTLTIDTDNLACFIVLNADKRGVGTSGPQWMTPDELAEKVLEYRNKYRNQLDIRSGDYDLA